VIDFVEAAYDLEVDRGDWLPKVIEAGVPVLDHGHGLLAISCTRPPEPGPLVVHKLYMSPGARDYIRGVERLQTDLETGFLWPLTRPGIPKTLSEVTDAHDPTAFRTIMRYFAFAKDGLGINAFDPSGRGVFLIAGLPAVTTLSERARERWHMLAAHLSAGYRLRRALAQHASKDSPETQLPFGAEIVIDPSDFKVTDAAGQAQSRPALASLRRAAKQIDSARGAMRESDPERALDVWRALVRGRWSTVDWFDSDGRRYVLGIPNAPDVLDPRGLTERELQVVSYVFYGLTNKMVAYHLGISKGRVSTLLHSAMRKLGVSTRAQLIKKLKDFEPITGA
jgi:DNA-binding CsgD family transcriptional regulator